MSPASTGSRRAPTLASMARRRSFAGSRAGERAMIASTLWRRPFRATNSVTRQYNATRVFVERRCAQCTAPFLVYDRRPKKFCSLTCANRHRVSSIRNMAICNYCRKVFQLWIGRVRQRKTVYCSMDCRRAFIAATRKHPTIAHGKREAARIRKARRRAITRELGSHTYQEWSDLVKRAHGRCAKCRKKAMLTKDHIIPLSKGGDDRITNIQPLCHTCNSRKNDRIEHLL